MGNIRQTYIKRVSLELLRKHGALFTTDFDVNKKLVSQLSDVQSKQLRNRIAGYATRLKRRHNLILQ